MYRGRYRQGDEVSLAVLCTDAAGTPVAPAAAPALAVLADSGRVAARALPVADPGGCPGLFGHRLYLGAGYPPGRYRAVYTWHAGGSAFAEADEFEVAPGGSADGPVLAMTHYPRPHASFVVHQLAGGGIKTGKNPSF